MVSPQHGECVVEHQGGGGAGAEEQVTALYLLVAGDPGPPHLLPLLALLAAASHAEPHVPALAHEHPAGRGGQLDTRYWLDSCLILTSAVQVGCTSSRRSFQALSLSSDHLKSRNNLGVIYVSPCLI